MVSRALVTPTGAEISMVHEENRSKDRLRFSDSFPQSSESLMGVLSAAVVITSAFLLFLPFVSQGTLAFGGGTGTSDDPYRIEDWYHLNETREDPSAFYELTQSLDGTTNGYGDLVNTDKGWSPIGGDEDFTGTFNGNGNSIRGLYINRPSFNRIGLFGDIGPGALVKNLSVLDVDVTGSRSVGGLVGHIDGGSVEDLRVTGELKGDYQTGGVAGWFGGGSSISSSHGGCNVSAETNRSGGLAGFVGSNCLIADSYVTGTVDGSRKAGGIAGYIEGSNSVVNRTYCMGRVTGTDPVGGLVGDNNGKIYSSFNAKNETDQSSAIGDGSGSLTDVYSLGNTEMKYYWTYRNSKGYMDENYLSKSWEIDRRLEGQDPNNGFPFLSWETEGSYTWYIYDTSLILETGSTGGGDVTVPGEGNFTREYGTMVDLEAQPNDNYYFYRWIGDTGRVSDTGSAQTNISMEDDYSVEAEFKQYSTLIIDDISGNGTVTVDGDEVNASFTKDYRQGEEVTLTASSDRGWRFEGWTGDRITTAEEINVTMDGDRTIGANFTVKQYNVALNVIGDGSTEPVEGTHIYEHGKELEINATPGGNWSFSHWTGDYTEGQQTATSMSLTVDENKTLRTYFENVTEAVEHNLTLMKVGDGQGSVNNIDGQELEEGNHRYSDGEMVLLEANSTEEYSFEGWEGDILDHYGVDEKEVTVEMDSSKDINASFAIRNEYDLKIGVEGGGTTDPEPGTHSCYEGEEVALGAISGEGWQFVEWTGDYPQGQSEEKEINVSMDGDKNITARFEELNYTLDVEVQGKGSVSVDPGGYEYQEGTNVTISATPQEGWSFSRWEGDLQGSDAETNLIMNESKTATAVFKEDPPFNLTVETSGEGEVDIDPDKEEYDDGVDVQLTASPDDGWEFVEWFGDYEGTEDEITVDMNSSKLITANFEEVETGGGGSGSSSGGSVVEPSLDTDPGSVSLKLEPGGSRDVHFELQNNGNSTASVVGEIKEINNYVDFSDKDHEIDGGKSIDTILGIKIPGNTNPGTYTGSVSFEADGFEGTELDVEMEVVDSGDNETQEENITLRMNTMADEFEPGRPVNYSYHIEVPGGDTAEISITTEVYDMQGNPVYERSDMKGIKGSFSYDGEIKKKIEPGMYVLKVDLEPTKEGYGAASSRAQFEVLEKSGVAMSWWMILIIVGVLLSSVAGSFFYREELMTLFNNLSGMGGEAEEETPEEETTEHSRPNVDIPQYLENWIEKNIEKGYSTEQLKQFLRKRGKDPNFVDVYLEGR